MTAPEGPDALRRFTPGDLAAQVAIGQVELSPDGEQVVYTRRHVVDGRDRTELWVVPFAGGEARRLTEGRDVTSPRFAPDGSALAWLAGQEDGSVQVVVADADGHGGSVLTRFPHGVDDLAWAPDGTWLVVSAADERASGEVGEARPGETATAYAVRRADWRHDGSTEFVAHPVHLHRIDRRTGDATRLTDAAWSASSPRVRPDGGVLFLADTRADGDVLPTPQVQLLDAAGELTQLTAFAGGVQALELVGDDAVAQAREAHADAAPVRLHRLDPAGELEPLMAGIDRYVGSSALYSDLFDWTAAYRDGGDVTIVAEAGCAVPTRFGAGRPEALVPPSAQPMASSIAVAGDRVALTLSTGRRFVAPDVHAVDAAGLRRLTTDGGAWLDAFALPTVTERTAEGAGGPIPTFVIDPPGVDPAAAPDRGSGPLPTVLLIHGGPSLQWNVVPMLESLILASAGYRVAMPNIRGSIHLGGDPIATTRGFWGEGDAADCHAVLDDLVAAGLADADRIGVAGLSYGGFLTTWLLGTSDRFAAAVSENGVANQVAAAGVSAIGIEAIAAGGIGQPWAETELLWDRSPLRRVEHIRTPLLMLQAAADRICPAADNEQLFVALRSLGREVEYVLYPEEGHVYQGAGRFDRRLDRHRRSLAWFQRWMPA